MFSTVSKDNFGARVEDLRPGAWRAAEIPFSALRGSSGVAGLSAADRLHTIGFVQVGGGAFYVDDVEIVDLDPP